MSSDPAVVVHHLSKEYALGLSGRSTSLRQLAAERIRHPIRGAGRRRERFRALDDVSFDVAAGEAVGIIGRNGAGKSTLLKILSRITPPTAGHVDLAGSVGSLLEVGTGFHPELTGIENVYLNGTILGMSRSQIDRRLDAIVEFSEVEKFLETPVKRYSSGMRVRLAFAVAAHLEPEVLIIDEVLSVGDAAFQAKCLDKMRSVATDDGRTVLYVSHNLVTVEHLCPRALLLVDGRLDFDGTTEDTLTRYLRMLPHAQRGASVGVFDLAAADRSGTAYQTVFRRLELRTTGGAPTEQIRMGERLQVAITVEGLADIPEPVVHVIVGSHASDCLFRMTTRMIPLRAAHERCSRETIVLEIPAVPLVPGDYHVDLAVGTDPRIGSGTVDEVRRAAEFSVIPADVYGTGHRMGPRDGQFLVAWDWELRPGDAGGAARTVEGVEVVERVEPDRGLERAASVNPGSEGAGDSDAVPDGGAPPVLALEPVALPTDPATVEAVIHHAVADAVRDLVRLDGVLADDDDHERIRSAWVSARRLRSHLRTFRGVFDREWGDRVYREVGWLVGELGPVRSADVVFDRSFARLAVLEVEERDATAAVLELLVDQQRDARDLLREALRSTRYAALREILTDTARSPRWASDAGVPSEVALRDLIRRAWLRLRAAVRELPDPPGGPAFRTVGTRAERARHAAESAVPICGEPAAELAKALGRVQDTVGEYEDAVDAEGWLRATLPELADLDPRAAEIARGLAAAERSAAHEARAAWTRVWGSASRKRLRAWLRGSRPPARP
ncbi:MAG: hypothetical protein AMXMBFR46_06960 [Acidimicrobiia bacterium]